MVNPFILLSNTIQIHHLLSLYSQLTKYIYIINNLLTFKKQKKNIYNAVYEQIFVYSITQLTFCWFSHASRAYKISCSNIETYMLARAGNELRQLASYSNSTRSMQLNTRLEKLVRYSIKFYIYIRLIFLYILTLFFSIKILVLFFFKK